MRKLTLIIFILYIGNAVAFSQEDALQLLNSVSAKLKKARDYSVDANIRVDIPFIRILPVDVTIYYRSDNKFRVKSNGIAVIPRQGFDQISKMIADPSGYTAILQGDDITGNIPSKIVNIIPNNDTSDLVLGKFWIDPSRDVIIKSQLSTRTSGTIHTDYQYGSQVIYGLPDAMIFTIDTRKFRLPKNMGEQLDATEAKRADKKGNIYIKLSNYKVNKGIPDSIFEK